MSSPAIADVAVVGGGIVGLSVAYCCARAGLRVTLVDAGPRHQKASWATAGIIGAQPYEQAKTPFIRLLGLGTRLHEQWAQELRELTGLDTGYRKCGGIELARDAEEAHALRSAAGHYTAHGVVWEPLSGEQLAHREPHLRPGFAAAYLVHDMAQARPPRLLSALQAACTRLGVAWHTRTTVMGFLREGDRIEGVVTPAGTLPAAATVVAAGAWSGPLLAQLGLSIDTTPVRGQVVLLEAAAGLVQHILMVDRHYIVPRFDGLYLVGSTQEHVGYDLSVTVDGIAALLDFARWLCPPLGSAVVRRTWSGLRPGNPDGKPLIGPAPGYRALYLATGHFRSGFLAGPPTGLLIKQLITGEEPCVPLWPFRPDRKVHTKDNQQQREQPQ